jgi:hypothetical protein
MHYPSPLPEFCNQTVASSANTNASPCAMPPGVRRDAAIAFQRLSNELPPGLHCALRQMLDSLVAVADGRPIRMFSDLVFEVTTSRVLVGPSSDDPVVFGVQRRFTVRAAQTCHRCGRKGHARQDLGGRVRCAKCAAPALLLHAIDSVLKQASPLRETYRSSGSSELPPLLRPAFRMYVEHHARIAPDMANEIGNEIFTGWLKLLRGLAREMRHGTALAA